MMIRGAAGSIDVGRQLDDHATLYLHAYNRQQTHLRLIGKHPSGICHHDGLKSLEVIGRCKRHIKRCATVRLDGLNERRDEERGGRGRRVVVELQLDRCLFVTSSDELNQQSARNAQHNTVQT